MSAAAMTRFAGDVRAGRRPQPCPLTRAVDIVAVADNADVVRFTISDASVDTYGTTFAVDGWVLDRYRKNPIVLMSHNSEDTGALIGNCPFVGVVGARLVADVKFLPADVNPQAETVRKMVVGGYLRGASVGFLPLEWKVSTDPARRGGIDFTKQELLEWSIVLVPSNPNSLAQARSAGIDTGYLERLAEARRLQALYGRQTFT